MKRLDPIDVSLLHSFAVFLSFILLFIGWGVGCYWAFRIGGGLDGDPGFDLEGAPHGVGQFWLELLPFATAAGAASLSWFPVILLRWRRKHLDRQEIDPMSN